MDSKNQYIKRVLDYSKKYNESLKRSEQNNIKLSQREIQILSLVAKGLKRNEIADHLMVSQATVKTHLHNIYKKLQVSGKLQAVNLAKMQGFI
nr:LuxR C-terminal-related transcriptional regulator [Clostridium tetanomorphum]